MFQHIWALTQSKANLLIVNYTIQIFPILKTKLPLDILVLSVFVLIAKYINNTINICGSKSPLLNVPSQLKQWKVSLLVTPDTAHYNPA